MNTRKSPHPRFWRLLFFRRTPIDATMGLPRYLGGGYDRLIWRIYWLRSTHYRWRDWTPGASHPKRQGVPLLLWLAVLLAAYFESALIAAIMLHWTR